MAIKGMNPAILKQILGHDDISTTFAIYTHAKESDSLNEMKRLGLVEPCERQKQMEILISA